MEDELEARLKKRDGRFILRLGLLLAIGLLAGLWLWSYLAGSGVGGCAARSFGTVTEAQ